MQIINLLATLQKTDSALDAARRQFSENKEAMQPDAALQKQAKRVKRSEAQVEKWRKERRLRDEKVAALTEKIAGLEKKLYGGRIKDAREQVAMQQNIQSLKRHLDTLEEAALEAMVALDEAEKSATQARARFGAMKQAWLDRKATLEQAQQELVKQARALKAQRSNLAKTLPPQELARYERMRQKYGGLAVAKLNGVTCSGCGASAPTSVVQLVHEGQMTQCPICGRLLYDS